MRSCKGIVGTRLEAPAAAFSSRAEAAASRNEASARTRPHRLKKRFASFRNAGRMIGASLSSLRTTGAVSSPVSYTHLTLPTILLV